MTPYTIEATTSLNQAEFKGTIALDPINTPSLEGLIFQKIKKENFEFLGAECSVLSNQESEINLKVYLFDTIKEETFFTDIDISLNDFVNLFSGISINFWSDVSKISEANILNAKKIENETD